MNLRRLRPALLTLALAGQSLVAIADGAPPDTILINGKIFTGDATHPYVQALAIRGDRIVATGNSTTILGTRRTLPLDDLGCLFMQV